MTRIEIKRYSVDMYYKFDEGISNTEYDEFILLFGEKGYDRGWKKAEEISIRQTSKEEDEFPIYTITVIDKEGKKSIYVDCYLSLNGNILHIKE